MKRIAIVALVVLALFAGCESLKRLGLTIERPTARFTGVDLTRLDFTEAELTARIVVENPNPVGITLAGFSYSFDVEGVEFLSGDHDRELAIAAFGESPVSFPLAVGFAEVAQTVTAVQGRDEIAWAFAVDLRFDLPVLGRVTVPVSREGRLPVARPPAVRVADLVLDSIGIGGAQLSLSLEVENPNKFAFTLESLSYSFAVGNRVWIAGATDRSRTVPANSTGEVKASFALSFTEFGRTVRDLLLGDEAIVYAFAAEARIDPDIEPLQTVVLPFNRSGQIDLRRR